MPFSFAERYASVSSGLHRNLCRRNLAPIPWHLDESACRTVGHLCVLRQSTGNDSDLA